MKHHSIAIFASGNGSNAVNLIQHFKHHAAISVQLLVCNNPEAGVLEKTKQLGIEVLIAPNESFVDGEIICKTLRERNIDWIVLAGFLRKIPSLLIQQYPNRIINIHPALLPKFGGKGMFGRHVHEAVLAANEKKSGISIHFVNEAFDEGKLIAQFETTVLSTDTPLSLAEKIHTLEQVHFPICVEQTILNQ
jgi:phosphoribosylglycinamide formyltransferase-1